MTKNKRKMVRILDPELFEKNKQSILKFEKERVGKLGGTSAYLTDSKAMDIMVGTCASAWGDGEDLHLVSQSERLQWWRIWS